MIIGLLMSLKMLDTTNVSFNHDIVLHSKPSRKTLKCARVPKLSEYGCCFLGGFCVCVHAYLYLVTFWDCGI